MYYLRIKLRFSWFIFLDMYKGGKVQTSAIYERMNKLNIIAKGEGFKKALIVSIGTDSLGAIVKSATSVMSEGLSAVVSKIPGIGNMGKMLGDVTKVYSEQLAQQVASYAEITGIYLLYMIANKEASQSEQEVNEYVYGLAEGE